jgi:hypothetical protein
VEEDVGETGILIVMDSGYVRFFFHCPFRRRTLVVLLPNRLIDELHAFGPVVPFLAPAASVELDCDFLVSSKTSFRVNFWTPRGFHCRVAKKII